MIKLDYYNDNDPDIIRWLRNLRKAGHIPPGRVDNRSITEVKASTVRKYRQVHLFAGIAGWALALKLARWPEDEPVWTGSCPCQPFSKMGKGLGIEDKRHLWPYFFRLIRKCRPPTVFGEQVADKGGRLWLQGVQSDLESLGYRFAAADLCAASVKAPHIRQRLFWVGDSRKQRLERYPWTENLLRQQRRLNQEEDRPATASSLSSSPWKAFEEVVCEEQRHRRIEPGTFPVAYGVPARVVKLRAYGNAIVPQVASKFIKAYMKVRNG